MNFSLNTLVEFYKETVPYLKKVRTSEVFSNFATKFVLKKEDKL